MLKNFLKIALRQLARQKFYSTVKIGGFALGIAACLLIGLYIHDQLSFDRDFPGAGQLYRVTGYMNENGTVRKGIIWQSPFAQALKTEFPEVQSTARLMNSNLFAGAGSNQVRPIEGTEDIYEEGFTYADSSLPDLFHFQMVYGNRAKALTQPQTLILSKRKADKLYPGQNPIGRQLILNDDKDHPWTIAGVMQDPPEHSHLQYDYYLSLSGHSLWAGEQQSWMASNYDIYVQLRPDADAQKLASLITPLIVKKYWIPVMQQQGVPDATHILDKLGFTLQPVSDIHLAADVPDNMAHVDRKYLWLFGAIGIFVILLASINFINLSTARSANRAKEVGLRKVVGSDRQSLVRQFLLESILTSTFSFVLAVILAWLLLPFFNRLAGTSMHFPWTAWWLAPGVLAASVVIGLIAGLYPAFYLSAFRPVQVLKGNISRGARHSGLRSGLVVFQFTTSVVLIIATIVVYGQMRFILNSKLGFDKDQVLLIQGAGNLGDQLPAFKNQLATLSGVQAVTNGDFLPVAGSKRNGNGMYRVGHEKIDAATMVQMWSVDVDYLKVMGMKIVEGRNFSPGLKTDSDAAIINQTMARQMGMQHPVGQRINWGQGQGIPIIGMVEDFNYESVKQPIRPVCLRLGGWSTVVALRTKTTDIKGLLAGIRKVWKDFSPQQAFRYSFLDESFAHMYSDVQQTGNIFTVLSILAICIACLGLFALSAFMAEQRQKEMGVRKVLGASVWQVAGLLSRDFLRLVGLAVIIGSPIAWWAMHAWLQDYVYRMSMGAGIFIGAAVLVMCIALLTISWQALKAGTANPVESLRAD